MPRPVRILIAPDAFKECMTAREAAEAIERGVQRACRAREIEARVVKVPISDGGAGLIDAAAATSRVRVSEVSTTGPLGQPVSARVADGAIRRGWGRSRWRVIESASAAGLSLVPPGLRDPEKASTRGVGELMLAAADHKTALLHVGLGNSATCDGGVGMLDALGVGFLDESGGRIERPTGRDLVRIARIDRLGLDPRIARVSILALCDVDNPLFGADGAARVFAPQKGATPEQVERLDDGLRNLARRCKEAGIEADPNTPRAGAAGGMGFALLAFCNARLLSGIERCLMSDEISEGGWWADLILTGAGRLDATDLRGKAVLGVSKSMGAAKPTIALIGSIGPGAEDCLARRADGSAGLEGGLAAYHVITPPGMSLDEALRRGPELLEAAAERVVFEWLRERERS